MPLIVSGPIVHPRADAWFRFPNPTAPYVDCGQDVVYLVQGFDSSFAGQPARALAAALAAYGIPKAGSLAPAPEQSKYGAVALDYDSEPIPQSTDACYIIVKYRTPIPRANGGGPALFVVSDDSMMVEEETSLNPENKAPLTITYTDPNPNDPDAKFNSTTRLASFGYRRPLRKLVISGFVVGKDMDDVRTAFGAVNERKWFGLDKGYWIFDEFRTEGTLLGNTWKVTVGFTTRVNEDWSEYEVYYNEMLGEYVEVTQRDIDTLRKQTYIYGPTEVNGMTKLGPFPVDDFATVFGIGGGSASNGDGTANNPNQGNIATNG